MNGLPQKPNIIIIASQHPHVETPNQPTHYSIYSAYCTVAVSNWPVLPVRNQKYRSGLPPHR